MKLKLMLGLLASAMIITQCDQANQEETIATSEDSSISSQAVIGSGSSQQDDGFVNVTGSVEKSESNLNLSSGLDYLIHLDCNINDGNGGDHYLDAGSQVARIKHGSKCDAHLELLIIDGEHIDPCTDSSITIKDPNSNELSTCKYTLTSIAQGSSVGFTYHQILTPKNSNDDAQDSYLSNLVRDIEVKENIGESAPRLELTGGAFDIAVVDANAQAGDPNSQLKSFSILAKGEAGLEGGALKTGVEENKLSSSLDIGDNADSLSIEVNEDGSACGKLEAGDVCYKLTASDKVDDTDGLHLPCKETNDEGVLVEVDRHIHFNFVRDGGEVDSGLSIQVDVCVNKAQ
jgi:hypothetical protein